MKIVLFSVFIGFCYICTGVYISIIYNYPIAIITTILTSPFIMVSLSVYMEDLLDYPKTLRNRFKLGITYEVSGKSFIQHSLIKLADGSNISIPKLKFGGENFYKYHCRGRCLKLDKEKAESFFLDPMKPSVNELTMFELCGYNDCIQTLGEPYDYSKSFDELFGYYMQQGFVNKIKYIIKNIGRF